MAAASLPPQCQGARCQLENQGNIDTGMSSPQFPLEKSFFFGAKVHKNKRKKKKVGMLCFDIPFF